MCITKPVAGVVAAIDAEFPGGIANPVPQDTIVGRFEIELNTINIAFDGQIGAWSAGANIGIPGNCFETSFFTASDQLPVHQRVDPFNH